MSTTESINSLNFANTASPALSAPSSPSASFHSITPSSTPCSKTGNSPTHTSRLTHTDSPTHTSRVTHTDIPTHAHTSSPTHFNKMKATGTHEPSDINRLLQSTLDRMATPDGSNNAIDDIDLSTYLAAKSTSVSPPVHQQPSVEALSTNQFSLLFPSNPSSPRIEHDNTQQETHGTLHNTHHAATQEDEPSSSDRHLQMPKEDRTASTADLLLVYPSSPPLGSMNDLLGVSAVDEDSCPIHQHLIQDSSSSPDLLYFSDDDLELLATGPGERCDQPSCQSLSVLEPMGDPIQRQPSPPPSQNDQSDNSSEIDDIINFFDCSQCNFPAASASQIVKQAVLSSPLPSRPAALVPQKELEDQEKKSIYVIYETSCTPVSWFCDTPNLDVREMILCTCDAIIDGGFVLREIEETSNSTVNTKDDDSDDSDPISTTTINGVSFHYHKRTRYEFEQFHRLQNGGLYVLEKATERSDLKHFTGDRWRRLKVAIDPIQHVESQKAIKIMKQGSNLLKHTNLGFPHLRQFQLTADCNRLHWYSTNSAERTTIQIHSIKEIRLGQKSPLFQKYKLPSLEHLSFSVIFDSSEFDSPLTKSLAKVVPQLGLSFSSLDLTCKDEFEYDHWVTGFKALVCHAHHVLLSKQDLLSHSRRFRRALESNNCGIKLATLPEIKDIGSIGLEECLELAVHSLYDLEKKLEHLQRATALSKERIHEFDLRYNINLVKAVELLSQFEDGDFFGYSDEGTRTGGENADFDDAATANTQVFRDKTEAEDDLLEYVRMHELLSTVYNLLDLAAKDVIEYKESNTQYETTKDSNNERTTASLKKINQLLWKAEVDFENVEDMYRRLTDRRNAPDNPMEQVSKKLVEFNTKLNVELQKVGDQISSALTNLFSAASTNAPSTLRCNSYSSHPVITSHARPSLA